jgi:DNA-binding MarR family transcriptional regulator
MGGARYADLSRWLPTCGADVLGLQEVTSTPGASEWVTYADGERTLPQRANLFDDVRTLLPQHQAMFVVSDSGPVVDAEGMSHRQSFGLASRMRALLDLQLARDLMRDSGLSDPDYDVLSTLSERDDPWRMSDLAGYLLWSSSRLAHQVRRMEERGLVRRTPHPDDARGALIALTARGRATLANAAPLHVASVRTHLIDQLSPAELRSLRRISEKVLAHLRDIEDA